MKLLNLDQAKINLQQMVDTYLDEEKTVLALTDRVIELANRFPNITEEESFCRIIERLFSYKNLLSPEKQKLIAKLFQTSHHLAARRLRGLLKEEKAVKELLQQHKDAQAIIRGRQKYSVPISLLEGEEMPCKTFFKSMTVQLADDSFVKVCQGMLAHFSEMVKAKLSSGMKPEEKLVLKQINHHQFDTLIAFLVTSQVTLINDDNVFPLLNAASYLQIPEVLEACIQFVYPKLDEMDEISIVELFNLVPSSPYHPIHVDLVNKMSTMFKEALSQVQIPPEFYDQLQYYRENLTKPIILDLGMTEIADDKLELLSGLSIRELYLSGCPKLTNKALSIIGTMPNIECLHLDMNEWVDDETLENIPGNIRKLSLSSCKGVSKKGLENLGKTNVRHLSLLGCQHLKDEDFTSFPDTLEGVDLRMCRNVGEQTMSRLGKMANLRFVILAYTQVTNEQIALLPKQLQFLDLSGCQMNENAVESISGMDELRELYLSSTSITNAGLLKLPKGIHRLHLNNCALLTNEGVEHLRALTYLRYIALHRNPAITSSVVIKFPEKVHVDWQEPQPYNLARRAFLNRLQ